MYGVVWMFVVCVDVGVGECGVMVVLSDVLCVYLLSEYVSVMSVK